MKGKGKVSMSAIVIRANGELENLGIITKNKRSFWDRFKNLFKRGE